MREGIDGIMDGVSLIALGCNTRPDLEDDLRRDGEDEDCSSRTYMRPPRSGRAQTFGPTTMGERS